MRLICCFVGLIFGSTGLWGQADEKPFHYGKYTTITCHRPPNTGGLRSMGSHIVTHIDGVELAKPFGMEVQIIDGFRIPGESEKILSGYFTRKEIGTIHLPKDAPERQYLVEGQLMWCFRDFFVGTGVIAPPEAKLEFEQKVINKRKAELKIPYAAPLFPDE